MQILIAGGYGVVGQVVTELLSQRIESIQSVVAGRNVEKTQAVAEKFNCKWTSIDLESDESIKTALTGIDVVINCYIPSADFNTLLAENAADMGIHYLDVGAFNAFNEKIVALHDLAVSNQATLITALGLYPGMASLILASNRDYFDEIDKIDIYFTSGGKMEGLSVLSLQGINYMMNITPQIWNGQQWVTANSSGTKALINKPFNNEISFYPFMVSYDLLMIPEMIPCNSLKMWSGTESLVQGLVFLLGMKANLASTVSKAKRFLKILQYMGKKLNENYSMKIVIKGSKQGAQLERVVEMNGKEEYLTALVPVLLCDQLISGTIARSGAFTGGQIADANDFINMLKTMEIDYSDRVQEI